MDKAGRAAGSCKLLYFFSSTIIKYSSSLSARIALCPSSLGKMSSSKAVCQVCQTYFSELFQIVSPLFYVEHCLFHEISHTKWLLSAEKIRFSPELLENSFPFWAGCSGICLSRYSLPCWIPAGLCLGSIQAGHRWSLPVCLQGQWVMLTALSPSSVVLMSVQSGSHYLHLSFFSPLFFH